MKSDLEWNIIRVKQNIDLAIRFNELDLAKVLTDGLLEIGVVYVSKAHNWVVECLEEIESTKATAAHC